MGGKELLKDHLIGQDKILNIKFKLSSFQNKNLHMNRRIYESNSF